MAAYDINQVWFTQDSAAVECRDTSSMWAETVHILRPSDQRCSDDEMFKILSSMLSCRFCGPLDTCYLSLSTATSTSSTATDFDRTNSKLYSGSFDGVICCHLYLWLHWYICSRGFQQQDQADRMHSSGWYWQEAHQWRSACRQGVWHLYHRW